MTDQVHVEPDLTSCDREPITFLDRIQNFGFLLALSNDWTIVRASANLGDFLDIEAEAAIGMRLDAIISKSAGDDIRNRMAMLYATGSERLFDVGLMKKHKLFDLNLHFVGELLILEGELSNTAAQTEAASMVRAMMSRLSKTANLSAFHRDAARQVRAITGFDRVMIYRFDATGAGEVIAESTGSGIEGFLGLHYPASDIPLQARALYLRNPFRIIADVAAVPVALLPEAKSAGQALDLSCAVTRAVSPVHIEYLGNMGVHASLSVSIIVGGELWGLIACHNLAARLPSFVARTAAELFGSMYSMMLESRLRQSEAVEEQRSRELADRLITAIAGNEKLVADPHWLQDMTRDMIDSDGVAIYSNGDVFRSGMVPPDADVVALARQLNTSSPSKVLVTDRLAELYAPAKAFEARAAGMLSIPISRMPRDYIMLFRCERMQMINWGGDPSKMVEASADGVRLSPRKSFAAFADVVRGKSEPFTGRDQRIGEAVRQAMIEVILRLTEVNSEDRRRAAERQELLIAELNHRVRNILALIRGLVTQTGSQAADISSYVASLGGRIQALARAHDLVTRQSWGPSDIRLLFDDEIAAHAKSAGHVTISGPPVLMHPQAISTLALVIHELMTNSVKYGALSSGGNIDVTVDTIPNGGVVIRWRERGGPAVQAPKRRGFGSVIVERTVPFDLEGTAEVRFVLAGFEADFFIPQQHVFVAESPHPSVGTASPEPRLAGPAEPGDALAPLAGLDILLVEDSMIIAIDAEYMLRDLGAASVFVASTIAAAEAAADKQRFGFAMLDVNVGTRTSFDFATRLMGDGVPYIFASGYGDQVLQSATQRSAVVVQKPYSLAHVAAAVVQTLDQERSRVDAAVNGSDLA